MRKKPNYGLYVGIGIFLLLIIIGAAFLFTQQSIYSGSGTLSLSQVDLQSSFAPLNGKAWVYTFTQNRLGQYLTGTVTTAQADAKYPGTEKPANDFSMKVTYDNQECVYPINIRYNSLCSDIDHCDQIMTLYQVQYDANILPPWGCDFGTNCANAASKCGANVPLYCFQDTHTWSSIVTSYKNSCHMVCGTQQTGAIGSLNNYQVDSKFTVAVSAKGQNYAQSFSTLSDNSNGKVGDNVYIQWMGNLVSGKACSSQGPYIPIYKSGSWLIADSNRYTEYKSTLLNFNPGTVTDMNLQMNTINTKANQALSPVSFGRLDSSTSLNSALLRLDVQSPIQYPVITAYIKADWLGIVTPIGKPQIQSTDSTCFNAGSDGSVRITIKNVGSEQETFKVYITCPSPFSGFSNEEASLAKDESKIVTIPLSADVSTLTKKDCVAHADGTQYQDTATFQACAKPNCQCTTGATSCDAAGLRIQKCGDDCVSYQVTQDCTASGQICLLSNVGTPYCATAPIDCTKEPTNPVCIPPGECGAWIKLGGTTILPDIGCLIKPYIIALSIFLGLLAMVITYIFAEGIIQKQKISTKKWSIPKWIVLSFFSLIAGAIVGLIFYWLWWVAVLGFIVYLIIMVAIKSIKPF